MEFAIQLVQACHPVSPRSAVFALAGAGVLVLAACAPLPPSTSPHPGLPPPETSPPRPADIPPPAPSPYGYHFGSGYVRGPEEVSGPAVLKLLDQARGEVSSGRAEQAMADLETALNIEPRNPFIWQQMASVHLQQHLPDQAEHKAQRSNSFARGNPYIEIGNWRVIAEARQLRGDKAGAEQAQARVEELKQQTGD